MESQLCIVNTDHSSVGSCNIIFRRSDDAVRESQGSKIVTNIRGGSHKVVLSIFEKSVLFWLSPLGQSVVATVQVWLDLFVENVQKGSDFLEFFKQHLGKNWRCLVVLDIRQGIFKEIKPTFQGSLHADRVLVDSVRLEWAKATLVQILIQLVDVIEVEANLHWTVGTCWPGEPVKLKSVGCCASCYDFGQAAVSIQTKLVLIQWNYVQVFLILVSRWSSCWLNLGE